VTIHDAPLPNLNVAPNARGYDIPPRKIESHFVDSTKNWDAVKF
jgi:hypothetical protein